VRPEAAPPFVVPSLPARPCPLGAAVRCGYTICAMRGVFVLPLYPLQGLVLLPGERCAVPFEKGEPRTALARARDHGGAVVASLVDGESVHEVGVTAIVGDSAEGETSLHGVTRCRLVSLQNDDALMVRVYLTDFADFDAFNAEYVRWFSGPLPSRTCVGVTGLAVGAAVEIDLVVGLTQVVGRTQGGAA